MASITLPKKRVLDDDDDATDEDYVYADDDDDDDDDDKWRTPAAVAATAAGYVRHEASAAAMQAHAHDGYAARCLRPGPMMSYFHHLTGVEAHQTGYSQLYQNVADHARKANDGTWLGMSFEWNDDGCALRFVNAERGVVYGEVSWRRCALAGTNRPYRSVPTLTATPTFEYCGGPAAELADGRVIEFTTYGVGRVSLSTLWLGRSTKRDDPSAIGAYGEGQKQAAVVLARERLDYDGPLPNTVRIDMLTDRGPQRLFAAPSLHGDMLMYFRRRRAPTDACRSGDYRVTVTGHHTALAVPQLERWLFTPRNDGADIVVDGVGTVRADGGGGQVYANRFLVECRRWLRHTVNLYNVLPTRERNSFAEPVRCAALARLWRAAIVQAPAVAAPLYLDVLASHRPYEECNTLDELGDEARGVLVRAWHESARAAAAPTAMPVCSAIATYEADVRAVRALRADLLECSLPLYRLLVVLPHQCAKHQLVDAQTAWARARRTLFDAVVDDDDAHSALVKQRIVPRARAVFGNVHTVRVARAPDGSAWCAHDDAGNWVLNECVVNARFAHEYLGDDGACADDCTECVVYVVVYELMYDVVKAATLDGVDALQRRIRRSMFVDQAAAAAAAPRDSDTESASSLSSSSSDTDSSNDEVTTTSDDDDDDDATITANDAPAGNEPGARLDALFDERVAIEAAFKAQLRLAHDHWRRVHNELRAARKDGR